MMMLDAQRLASLLFLDEFHIMSGARYSYAREAVPKSFAWDLRGHVNLFGRFPANSETLFNLFYVPNEVRPIDCA